MKYLNKYNNFNSINESFEESKRDEFLPEIIDILSDMIDDKFQIILETVNKKFTLNIFLESSKEEQMEYLDGFNPVFRAGNKIKSEFKISVKLGEFDYDKLTKIINEMGPVKNRLGDLEWNLSDMRFNFDSKSYKFIIYKFTKPDVVTDAKPPSEKEIKDRFEQFGMTADVEYDDNICYVGAESNSYDGEFPDDIEDKLDRMLKMFGFDYYEHELNRTRDWLTVKFWVNPSDEEID